NDADSITELEKLLSRFRCSQIATVLPEQQADFMLSREINGLAQLALAPARPEAFDDLILKTQLPRQLRKVLYLVKRILATVQILPHSAPRLEPFGLDSRWE